MTNTIQRFLIGSIIFVFIGAGCNMSTKENSPLSNTNEQPISSTETMHTALDLTALPLGTGKYVSSPTVGAVYTCQRSFSGSGAFANGLWIDEAAGTWDETKKITVDGSVSWPNAEWHMNAADQTREFETLDLPTSHTTGNFPISSQDDAYAYDRNPNAIDAHQISFSVPLDPTVLDTPRCVGGEVGISFTGVLLFNAFDAGGRDAVATEIQDSCDGHPQAGGYYHYHGYSDCFDDTAPPDEHSELLGYAFDGFGIYGLRGENGEELSSSDLDECHGHTHTIEWDGKEVALYHYHFTKDFPYTVGCFRGTPSVTALSQGEEPKNQQGPGAPNPGALLRP